MEEIKKIVNLLLRTIFCFSILSTIVLTFEGSSENSSLLLTPNITLEDAKVVENKTVFDREHGGVFLTQYINNNQTDKGRELAEVNGLPGGDESVNSTKSFSGYFTVDADLDSNMFFWFFPAKNLTPETPLILWLSGGPGSPSTFGLFIEVGPFKIDKDHKVTLRDYSWTDKASVLFIDNPVGTGYSFTGSDEGYAKTVDDYATNLYTTLTQFFQLFPDQQNRSFFIFGESYGGKYAPAISEKIAREGDSARELGMNLKGVAVGNGLCDPIRQTDYGVNLYQLGLINARQMEDFKKVEGEAKKFMSERKFDDGFRIVNKIMASLNANSSLFMDTTGLKNYYNYQADIPDPNVKIFMDYIVKANVQKAAHARENPTGVKKLSEKVMLNLWADIMDSVKPRIEYILDQNIPMLFYSGQLDLIIPTSFTSAVLHALEWEDAEEFRKAERTFWRAKKDSPAPDGYIQKAGNLIFQSFRKGGHMLPADLPETSYLMMSQFVDLYK